MAFDRKAAEAAVVAVVDALNGDRIVGTGIRLLDDTIATSCLCLPRPAGRILLPDPDAPGVLVLVRVRKPGTADAASGIVTAADPYSRLALVRSATAAGLTVPEELNPVMTFEQLVRDLAPALPEVGPRRDGPVCVCTHERRWVEGTLCGVTMYVDDAMCPARGELLGAPVFDDDGRVVGIVSVAEDSRDVQVSLMSDNLPGWLLRAADDTARSLGAA